MGSSSPGSGSIQLIISAGSFGAPFYVQGLDSSGTATVTAIAPAYANGTTTITLMPSGFIIYQTSFSTTTFSADTSLSISSARLDPGNLTYQGTQSLRAGIAPVSVAVTSANLSVGTITTSPLTFNGGDSTKFTAFDPVSAGTSLIQISTPLGFSTPSSYQQITGNGVS